MSRLSDYSKFDQLDCSDDDEKEEQDKKDSNGVRPVVQMKENEPSSVSDVHTTAATTTTTTPTVRFRRSGASNSHRFVLLCHGVPVYEWEQSLSDVTIYIPTPPHAVSSADQLLCQIQPQHLRVGIRDHVVVPDEDDDDDDDDDDNDEKSNNHSRKTQQYFLDEDTIGKVDVSNSTWTWEPLHENNNDKNNNNNNNNNKNGHHETTMGGVLTIELQKAAKGVVWDAACVGPESPSPSPSPSPSYRVRLDAIQLEEEKRRLLLERWQEENPGMDFRDAAFNGSAPDPRTFMGGVSYT